MGGSHEGLERCGKRRLLGFHPSHKTQQRAQGQAQAPAKKRKCRCVPKARLMPIRTGCAPSFSRPFVTSRTWRKPKSPQRPPPTTTRLSPVRATLAIKSTGALSVSPWLGTPPVTALTSSPHRDLSPTSRPAPPRPRKRLREGASLSLLLSSGGRTPPLRLRTSTASLRLALPALRNIPGGAHTVSSRSAATAGNALAPSTTRRRISASPPLPSGFLACLRML